MQMEKEKLKLIRELVDILEDTENQLSQILAGAEPVKRKRRTKAEMQAESEQEANA